MESLIEEMLQIEWKKARIFASENTPGNPWSSHF